MPPLLLCSHTPTSSPLSLGTERHRRAQESTGARDGDHLFDFKAKGLKNKNQTFA